MCKIDKYIVHSLSTYYRVQANSCQNGQVYSTQFRLIYIEIVKKILICTKMAEIAIRTSMYCIMCTSILFHTYFESEVPEVNTISSAFQPLPEAGRVT